MLHMTSWQTNWNNRFQNSFVWINNEKVTPRYGFRAWRNTSIIMFLQHISLRVFSEWSLCLWVCLFLCMSLSLTLYFWSQYNMSSHWWYVSVICPINIPLGAIVSIKWAFNSLPSNNIAFIQSENFKEALKVDTQIKFQIQHWVLHQIRSTSVLLILKMHSNFLYIFDFEAGQVLSKNLQRACQSFGNSNQAWSAYRNKSYNFQFKVWCKTLYHFRQLFITFSFDLYQICYSNNIFIGYLLCFLFRAPLWILKAFFTF